MLFRSYLLGNRAPTRYGNRRRCAGVLNTWLPGAEDQATFYLACLIETGHGDVALAVEAMKIGAADFFEKPFDDDLLLASVRSALREQEGQKKRYAERAEIETRIAALSPRERDVLRGLIEGRANKQIAFDLGISPRTVEIYRANLMNKMQADSLSDLVRMALVAGMLDAN